VPDDGRYGHEEQYCQKARPVRIHYAPRPKVHGEQQDRQKRQRAQTRQHQGAIVVPAVIENINSLLGTVRRRGAEGVGTGEVRSESNHRARQRRMLSVEFVFAPVQELHARGQVLGFVPGMAENPPGTGGKQTGNENEECK